MRQAKQEEEGGGNDRQKAKRPLHISDDFTDSFREEYSPTAEKGTETNKKEK